MFGRGERRHEALIDAGYRYACALARDPDGARDLVHDAWLSLLARHGTAPDRALLFRAIRHRHIDEYRRRRRAGAVDFDDADVATHAAAGGDAAPADPTDPRLERALGTLRDVERETLFLAVVEGYTASEIGEMTDSPRGTVLSLLHRARVKLRLALEREETESVVRLAEHRRVAGREEGKR